MRKSFILILIVLVPLSLLAQFKAQTRPLSVSDHLKAARPSFGILNLDPSRFSMQHSYSMSYASIGGKSFTQGLYLNTMTYQFNIPLTLSLQLGMAHNPFESTGTPSILQNGFFLSGAQLRYQPTKNTILQVDFQRRPMNFYPGYYGQYDHDWDWLE